MTGRPDTSDRGYAPTRPVIESAKTNVSRTPPPPGSENFEVRVWCPPQQPSRRRNRASLDLAGEAPEDSGYAWEPANGSNLAAMEAEISGRPAPQATNVGSRVGDVLSGAARGTVGAMAMTGMRVLTTELGLVEQTPPQAVGRQRARGVRALLRRAPRKQRRGLIEAAHWAFGAGGGAAFGALPPAVRRRPLQDRCTGWWCGWASSWGSRPPWASARPSVCA